MASSPTLADIVRRIVRDNPGWTLTELERDAEAKRYLAVLERDGLDTEIGFTPDGRIYAVARETPPADLPPAVLRGVQTRFAGAEVRSAQACTNNNVTYYELDVAMEEVGDLIEREVRTLASIQAS